MNAREPYVDRDTPPLQRELHAAERQMEVLQDRDEVWALLLHHLSKVHLDWAVYITRAAENPPDYHFLSNMPQGWDADFQQSVGEIFDPLIDFGLDSYEIKKIGVPYFHLHPYLKERDKNFISAAGEVGFRTGIAVPVRLIGSPRIGGYSLGSPLEAEAFERMVMPHVEAIRSFCLIAHRRLEDIRNGFSSAPRQPLSPREKQCMTLLAGGMRIQAISDALGISESAVAKYIASSRQKLGAKTREEAIARAIVHKHITTGD